MDIAHLKTMNLYFVPMALAHLNPYTYILGTDGMPCRCPSESPLPCSRVHTADDCEDECTPELPHSARIAF